MTYTKGLSYELKVSRQYHAGGLPVLIDPQILRSRQMGQVDLCRIVDRNIEVTEVKSQRPPHRRQWLRLQRSLEFLSQIFQMQGHLRLKTIKQIKSL